MKKISLILIISLFLVSCNMEEKPEVCEKGYEYVKISDGYDFISNLTYSDDGKNIAFIAVHNGKNILIKNGDIINDVYEGFLINPLISKNGKSFSFIIKGDNNVDDIIVKDGKKIIGYKEVGNLKYSYDGKSFAFMAIKDGKGILVKDGEEINKYDGIVGFEYSPDGKNFAYTAINKKEYIFVVNGKEVNKEDLYKYEYFDDGNEKKYPFIKEINKKYYVGIEKCYID